MNHHDLHEYCFIFCSSTSRYYREYFSWFRRHSERVAQDSPCARSPSAIWEDLVTLGDYHFVVRQEGFERYTRESRLASKSSRHPEYLARKGKLELIHWQLISRYARIIEISVRVGEIECQEIISANVQLQTLRHHVLAMIFPEKHYNFIQEGVS